MSDPRSLRRQRHRDRIYRLIRVSDGITRGALATQTGLSISTVGHALDALTDNGLIFAARYESKGPGSGSGRPAALYRAVGRGLFTGAIDFGHRHVTVAIGNDLGKPLDETRLTFEVDGNAEAALDLAAVQLRHLCDGLGVPTPAVAGIPWALDRSSGLVSPSPHGADWIGMAAAAELERRLTVPVRIENDAALGALGERAEGAGATHDDFIYVKASHGVGVGFVLNGELYTGANGLAGELVHTPVPGGRKRCRCGRQGCFATVWPRAELRALVRPAQNPSASWHASPSGTSESRDVLAGAGHTLGVGLAALCTLLNPSAVIVGGTLGDSGDAFVDGIAAGLRSVAPAAITAGLAVLSSRLGARTELIGALHHAALLAVESAA